MVRYGGIALSFIGTLAVGAFVAPEALTPSGKGPPATLDLAREVNGLAGEYSFNQLERGGTTQH